MMVFFSKCVSANAAQLLDEKRRRTPKLRNYVHNMLVANSRTRTNLSSTFDRGCGQSICFLRRSTPMAPIPYAVAHSLSRLLSWEWGLSQDACPSKTPPSPFPWFPPGSRHCRIANCRACCCCPERHVAEDSGLYNLQTSGQRPFSPAAARCR